MATQTQFGALTLRTCHTVGEFRQVFALQKEVWSFSDAELVPVRIFVVAEKIGGHVIAALEGNEMVAFAFDLPGVRNGHVYLHSHMLAVREQYRNSGIGRRLKMMQRDIALETGIELIEWTFDPLEIKNAFFNVEKLGAIARRYVVNQYGITTSPLQGGLPSDRLVAEWWLRSKRVQTLLEHGKHPWVRAEQGVSVPHEIYRWKAEDATRKSAAELQHRNREALQSAFSSGLSVLGYKRDEQGNGTFELARWDEGLLL
ncbi:MAG TPA: GNAT family N-acetyltransferase [candidate division Zixibacteria bacterium]|nr:GNAT family N-acetyltransferase [candidate division Zixibacteria bacterium]